MYIWYDDVGSDFICIYFIVHLCKEPCQKERMKAWMEATRTTGLLKVWISHSYLKSRKYRFLKLKIKSELVFWNKTLDWPCENYVTSIPHNSTKCANAVNRWGWQWILFSFYLHIEPARSGFLLSKRCKLSFKKVTDESRGHTKSMIRFLSVIIPEDLLKRNIFG